MFDSPYSVFCIAFHDTGMLISYVGNNRHIEVGSTNFGEV